MKPPRRDQASFALIVVLFMIAIISILFVGFIVTMRTERMAAAAMAGNERAKIVAQDALEHATALLENNIPEPVGPGQANPNSPPENWCISPGLLTKFSGPLNTGTVTQIPLSSTTNADPTALASGYTSDYVNLNAQQLSSSSGTATYPIIPTGEPLPVSWVYVLKDPTAPASTTNQIIGRYAFWMDDENARINVNTAYGKPATILNTITGGTNTYLERSNPLDRTTDNGFIANSGSDPFNSDVGFDSLVGSAYTEPGTNWVSGVQVQGNVNYNYVVYPNSPSQGAGATPAYPPGTNVAMVVGNPSTVAPAPVKAMLRYYPLWHPAAVNIDILPTSLSNASSIGAKDNGGLLDRNSLADWVLNKNYTSVNTYTQNWRLLPDPAQIQDFVTNAAPGPANFYQANKFNLTAYNRAPEFTVFGKPRLLMEDRIQTMQDPAANVFTDTCHNNLSGAELAFYTTPDIDPNGPMYFHGYENVEPYNAGAGYFPDLTAVQMVGDYLSTMLSQNNWPGMPAKSFVDKYSSGYSTTLGQMEADQVAWNIVSLGNYAPNEEGDSGSSTAWPDCFYNDFFRTANQAYFDSVDNFSPYSLLVSSQAGYCPTSTASTTVPDGAVDPNRCLRVGKLSGKAIMPFSSKPYVNEVALIVTAVPVTGVPNAFYLKFSLDVEVYVPKRGPPGSFWPHNNQLDVALTHFFFNVSGTNPSGVATGTITQGATGTPWGDGGVADGYGTTYQDKNYMVLNTHAPFVAALFGGFPTQSAATQPVVTLPANTYDVCTTTQGSGVYVPTTAAGTAMQYEFAANNASAGLPVNPLKCQQFNATTAFGAPSTIVNIQAKFRLFLDSNNNSSETWEIVPVWDTVDNSTTALKPPSGQADSLAWNFKIDLSTIPASGGTFTQALEVADPRMGGNSSVWQADPNNSSTSDQQNPSSPYFNLGQENPAQLAANFDADSYCFYDFQNQFYPNSPRPSIGFLSCVPTGQQRGIVNSILTFGPTGATVTGLTSNPNPAGQLPDWLLLDLLAPTFPDTSQPSFAPYNYLHSTMGKININATLFPTIVNSSGTLLKRWLPLEAVFQNMDTPDTISSAGATPPSGSIVANIMNHTLSGQTYGAMTQTPPAYDYIGELCEVKGVADGSNTPGGTSGTNWQRMALIRNLANLFTTQSNTFHVWGAAQAVQIQKGSGNASFGAYQSGDTVTVIGEKRFESVLERKVWPGVDGVPGNGSVSASGTYNASSSDTVAPLPAAYPWAGVTISGTTTTAAIAAPLGSTTATWAQFDGPDNANQRASSAYTNGPGWYVQPTYTSSLLINAKNPARAHMYFKPIVFRYLTE